MYHDPSGLSDVMLRYIIEKNGGNVRWESEAKLAVVSLNGYTHVFRERDYRVENGRMIVDHTELMGRFRLTESQALHHSWDPFYSMDDAALAFSLMYRDEARSREGFLLKTFEYTTGCEVGVYLYSFDMPNILNNRFDGFKTYYTYGDPFWGLHDTVIPGLITHSQEHLASKYTRVGMHHIHPDCECHDGDYFSDPDYLYAKLTFTTVYVDTPGLGIKKYNPIKRRETIIFKF